MYLQKCIILFHGFVQNLLTVNLLALKWLCCCVCFNTGVFRRGLYISDIPLHDATRDLVLMSEQFEADYKLTRNLELLTDKLQQTYRELEGEKEKTDRYTNTNNFSLVYTKRAKYLKPQKQLRSVLRNLRWLFTKF